MMGRGTVPGVPTEDPGKNARPGPGMPDREYRELVAREGKQTWTKADEESLAAKARRIR